MIRLTPQPGEKWRHFRNVYTVIAIATFAGQSWVIYSKSGVIPWRIFSTEDSRVFRIRHHSDMPNPVVLDIVETGEIWKESEVNSSTIWARPLDNFMEVLSNDGSDRASNYYRLERVEAEVTTQQGS